MKKKAKSKYWGEDNKLKSKVAKHLSKYMNNLIKDVKAEDADEIGYLEYLTFQIVGSVIYQNHSPKQHKDYVAEQIKVNKKG